MDLKQQTIDTYNTTAEAMAVKFNNIGGRKSDVDRGFSFIDKTNPFAFEIGCGNGRDAIEILKHTENYLGTDISKSMIELARVEAPTGKFEVVDIDTYEFPLGIDIIFSFASLLHSESASIKSILESAYSALNPGGVFYISLKFGEGSITKTDEFGTRTYFLYTPDDIKKFAGGRYDVVYEDVHDLRDQKWFTLALKKK
ncbi:MAG: class I SAM-dependent methyltransferase [Candidatus Magasanikbacteria bacterium]|nr:class I SAM-dependent methyltransferase [Candidatus Magasanikbacteria bacterium]